MRRIIATLLIALIAISSGLAHAHGGAAEKDGLIPHHSEASTSTDHGDDGRTGHEERGSACVFGHCATACGVILPSLAMAVSVALTAANHEYGEQTFAGLISISDPPPPKS